MKKIINILLIIIGLFIFSPSDKYMVYANTQDSTSSKEYECSKYSATSFDQMNNPLFYGEQQSKCIAAGCQWDTSGFTHVCTDIIDEKFKDATYTWKYHENLKIIEYKVSAQKTGIKSAWLACKLTDNGANKTYLEPVVSLTSLFYGVVGKNIDVAKFASGRYECSLYIKGGENDTEKLLDKKNINVYPTPLSESECSKYSAASFDQMNNPLFYGEQQSKCIAAGCQWDMSGPTHMCKYIPVDNAARDELLNSNDEINPDDNVSGEDIEVSCEGLLGGFRADLSNILKAFRIIAPILVGGLSVYEYLMAIFKGADEFKKVNKRLIKRLVLIAVLFFLPTILDIVLGLVDKGTEVCID